MKKRRLNGLRVQISLFYIMASMAMVLLIGFILYYSISAIVREGALDTTIMAVDKSGDHIESYIKRIKGISLVVAEDPSLIRYLSGSGAPQDSVDVLK